jgi:hypothetical protein
VAATRDDDGAWDFGSPGGAQYLPPGSADAVPRSRGGSAPVAVPTGGPVPPPGEHVPFALPQVSRPPTGWLLAATAVAVLALLLGLTAAGSPRQAFLGWAVAGFGSTALLAVFTLRDAERRADPWYARSEAIPFLRAALLVLVVVAVSVNAWHFADWVSR